MALRYEKQLLFFLTRNFINEKCANKITAGMSQLITEELFLKRRALDIATLNRRVTELVRSNYD